MPVEDLSRFVHSELGEHLAVRGPPCLVNGTNNTKTDRQDSCCYIAATASSSPTRR